MTLYINCTSMKKKAEVESGPHDLCVALLGGTVKPEARRWPCACPGKEVEPDGRFCLSDPTSAQTSASSARLSGSVCLSVGFRQFGHSCELLFKDLKKC